MKKLIVLSLLFTMIISSIAGAFTTKPLKIETTYKEKNHYYAITQKDKQGNRWVIETNKKDYKKLVGKKVTIEYKEYKKYKGEYYIKSWRIIK